VVDRVRHLAQSLPDQDIADRLNQEGQVSALGKPFTGSMIKWIRYRYQIPTARLMRPEELTVQQVAERFRVSPNVVYYWPISARCVDERPHIWRYRLDAKPAKTTLILKSLTIATHRSSPDP
jgi:hypothetical protein